VEDEIKKPYSELIPQSSTLVVEAFNDPEARRNIVGLFDLLLKIDRRLNGQDEKNIVHENPPKS
jgi:hypothetical protein